MRSVIISEVDNALVKILWIEECKGGIYLGYYGKAKKIHQSYHVDGNVHLKVGSEYLKLYKTLPLKDVKSFISLGSNGITLDSDYSFVFSNYQRIKNADAIIYINPEVIKRKKILNVDAYILHKNAEGDCFIRAQEKSLWRSDDGQGFELINANFFKLEKFPDHILGVFLYGGIMTKGE